MENSQIKIHKFDNGITLLGERMDFVQSAAFSILVPTGAATDPKNMLGSAGLLAEMLSKGAGSYNSKQLSQQFEEIGLHKSHSAGIEVSVFSGALLGENLIRALELHQLVLREPHLPDDDLENVRSLALQELMALEEEPSSKVMVELARCFYPEPYGRSQYGTIAGVKAVTLDALRDYYKRSYVAGGAIIGVAGKFNWEEVKSAVADQFSSWQGSREVLPICEKKSHSSVHHVESNSAQLQIALASHSVSYDSPHYYSAKVAVGVLSGGMAGRLFVEVREKRGLVYRVSASHSAARGRAAIFVYAGTTSKNGQETLDVILAELNKLGAGVSEDELKRSVIDLKSRLIMQSESSSVRASALVNDWWNIGRVRPLVEIKSGIDSVTNQTVIEYLQSSPFNPLTLVVLGEKSLELPQCS